MRNAQQDRIKKLLFSLSESSGISGYEHSLIPKIKEYFGKFTSELNSDSFGNFYAIKRGESSSYSVMLAAHMDEIGLMVKMIDPKGYLRFTTVGGVDQRTLLSQEVTIHGTQDVAGVIGSMPPHLLKDDHANNSLKLDELAIDVGLSYEEVTKIIRVGDPISLRRKSLELLNDAVAGKAFDDRAGIAVMAVCIEELKVLSHKHDVIFVSTTQEEVGIRGAITSAYTLDPDLAIAIDVTHAVTPDTKGTVQIELGKGPTLALGPNIHPHIYNHLTEAAVLNRIPHQVDPIPGISGTDAWAIQVTRSGIPTGLLSIPLRYMHTSVETLSMQDVINSGKLLAYFISSLPEDLEEFLCS